MSTLYYGDNLKILREYIKDESKEVTQINSRKISGEGGLKKIK